MYYRQGTKMVYCTVKNIGDKKLWRIRQITAIRQVFLPIFTISITFPVQMDFNAPKFFPPNFQESLFTKPFYCQSFLLYGMCLSSNNIGFPIKHVSYCILYFIVQKVTLITFALNGIIGFLIAIITGAVVTTKCVNTYLCAMSSYYIIFTFVHI